MKNFSSILSILAFIGVCILGFLHFKSNKPEHKAHLVSVTDTSKNNIAAAVNNIAYVDLDTLEEYHIDFKKKKAEFESVDKNLGAELEKLATALQRDAMDVEKKAQAGQLTQDQYKASMMKLQQRQQELEAKKQNEGSSLIKKQEDFNANLQKEIRGYLKDYAEDNGYDFVLAYTKSSTILYSNPQLDITHQVIDALNSGKTYSKKDTNTKNK